MIGVDVQSAWASATRISRVTAVPSSWGVCTSSRIRSQGSRFQASMAATPSPDHLRRDAGLGQ